MSVFFTLRYNIIFTIFSKNFQCQRDCVFVFLPHIHFLFSENCWAFGNSSFHMLRPLGAFQWWPCFPIWPTGEVTVPSRLVEGWKETEATNKTILRLSLEVLKKEFCFWVLWGIWTWKHLMAVWLQWSMRIASSRNQLPRRRTANQAGGDTRLDPDAIFWVSRLNRSWWWLWIIC